MKKVWKRTIAVLLVVIMVGGTAPVTASAKVYSGTCGEDANWSFDPSEGFLTISGMGEMENYWEPASYCAPWDALRPDIKEVKVNEGITHIGHFAFYGCSTLTRVSLPNSLASIGTQSFQGCRLLSSVSIPYGVQTIDSGAFMYCEQLKSVTLPESIREINFCAFADCSSLTSIILPNDMTSISNALFSGCSSLTSIHIPKQIVSVGDYAFAECNSLSNVTYQGTQQQWNAISVGLSNDCLMSATIHYNIGVENTSLYNIVLDQYRELIEENYYQNSENWYDRIGVYVNQLIAQYHTPVYYSYYDIDHNGKHELVISDNNLGDHILDIFTYANGKIYELQHDIYGWYSSQGGGSWGDRAQVYLIDNGNVVVDGSGGASLRDISIYQYDSDGYTVKKIDSLLVFYDNSKETYYRGSKTLQNRIDVDEFRRLIQLYTNQSYSSFCSNVTCDLKWEKLNINETHLDKRVFNEATYIADIWLSQERTDTTIESQLVSEMMDYYSPSSDMYLSLKSDTAFQVAVAGWNGFKTVSDPAGSGKRLSNVSDIYETLILDMLERATNNDAENYNNAFVNALDIAGESADVITDFKDAVDHFDDALAKGSITLDTIRNWKVNPGDDTWVKFSKSFEAAGENNKTPWGESKFVEGIGTIAEGISDVSDFYKRLCAYMYACNMKTDMVEFLTEMGKQSLPSHFRTALNNVLNAVNDTNYASLICTLELGEDLAFDVLKGVWKDLSKLFPIYGFFKTVIDGAMAVDNMLFNTQSIVDKYFLLEATYNYFSATKSVIGNTKNRYLSNRTEKNAAAYVFAMRNFQYAYEIDLESAVAFTKAADDEGVVNGVKNGARLLSNLITGANEKTNYQKMSDSADSIKASLASLFHTLDTSWKFDVGYLKTDYPDVYPIYVQKELSKAEYTPVITDKYLSQKGSSNIEWFIPYGYTDKDGNYHHMSSYIVDGVDATETASGSTTSRSSALDDGNGYVVEFVNNSTFTSFPKTYSIKGYSNTGSGKVYTGTKTESFENPLKKPIVGIPSDSQMLTNISSGFTAIGIYDATQKRYENIKYKIFRRTATSSWKLLDTIDKTDSFLLHRTIYKDLTATAKQNYYYKVSSYIDFGNGKRLDSPESDVVCMRVSDVVNNAMNLILTPVQNIVHAKAPKKAINKAQTNTGTNDKSGIQLTWNPVSGVSGYEIYRLASYGTTYKLIDTVTTETTSYIDESVSDGITYSYVVIPYVIASGNKEYAPQNNGNNSLSYPCSSGRKITDYAVGDIIEFGSYPQSKVKDGATISALNARATNWQSYGYMSGKETDSYDGSAQSSDYMKYCDIEYNGAYYRGVRFTTYRPNYTSYASTASGDHTSQDENGYSVNTTYWFKYEHLKWRVLNPATGLVLCESIIDSQPYSNTLFNYAGENYKDAQHNYYANNYAQSSIREFLNDTFYETAFSASEQSQIVAKSRENKAFTSSYSQFDSASSTDKITLLTSQDMVNTSYGFSSNQNNNDVSRRTSGTDYAKCQGLSINPSYQSTDGEYSSYWWLRSAGQFSASACSVWHDGRSDISFSYVTLTNYGVRPALNFNLTSAIVSSSLHGSGSGDNPTVPVTGLSINETSMRIGAGSVTTLHATVTPSNATNKAVTWSTSNSSVATVSDSGIVVAKAKGTAIITAKTVDGGKTATCVVTVLNPDELLSVEFLIPVWDHIIVGCGDSYTVRTKINCEAGVRYTVEWKTGSDFMSVDQNGCVTGIKPGSGQVDCVVRDEYGEQVSLILLVDVVQISIPDITITYKQSARLSPEIEGNRYVVSDGSVHYLSNNKNISVNSNGEIETKHGGKETVTCVWTDKTGSYQVTKKCTVTVKYTWWQVLIRIFLLGFIWY